MSEQEAREFRHLLHLMTDILFGFALAIWLENILAIPLGLFVSAAIRHGFFPNEV